MADFKKESREELVDNLKRSIEEGSRTGKYIPALSVNGCGNDSCYCTGKCRDLSIKVDVDVSEALTGLKAVTRQAREATKAVRELEEAQKGVSSPITVSPLTVGEPSVRVGSGFGGSASITSADYSKFRPYKGGESE